MPARLAHRLTAYQTTLAVTPASCRDPIRPGIRIKLAVLQIPDLAAVTLPTSICCSWTALHYFSQHVVQGPDELCCLSMTTLFELFHFFAVTASTVAGCDNHGDAMAVVLKGCRIFVIGTMARVAVHILLCVSAFSPLLHNARRATTVAIQACLTSADTWARATVINGKRRKLRKTTKRMEPPLDNIFAEIICSATFVPVAEELHQQRHHDWESGRIGPVQLSLSSGEPV
jgi:hypothetical protein